IMSNGDLHHFLRKNFEKKVTWKRKIDLFWDINLGFSQRVTNNSENSKQPQMYGVIPNMAPEFLRASRHEHPESDQTFSRILDSISKIPILNYQISSSFDIMDNNTPGLLQILPYTLHRKKQDYFEQLNYLTRTVKLNIDHL
ncbi:743_t:CDS:2, partial [Diversispora eburnea]